MNSKLFLIFVLFMFLSSYSYAGDPLSHITGVSNRTHALTSFINLVPNLISIQCTNTSVDTFGSFHKCQNNNVSGAVGIGIDFRWQENIYGLAYLYNLSNNSNPYYNNLTLKKSAIIGADNLIYGVDDNGSDPSWEWSEYGGWKTGYQGRVATFFTGSELIRTYNILNSSIENFCFEEDASNNISGEGTSNCGILNYTVSSRYTWINDSVLNTTYFIINGSNNQQHINLIVNNTGIGTRSWDIDNDTIIDGFVNFTVEYYDNFTGQLEFYYTNNSGTYVWHAGDIVSSNTSQWKNTTFTYSHLGIYDEATNLSKGIDSNAKLTWRTSTNTNYVSFRIQPTQSNIMIRNIKVEYNRKTEWDRVIKGICDHINDDYSNPTYDIPAANQWLGGSYTLFLCAERFSNQTYNDSAIFMLNRTLNGGSNYARESDGVFKELKGFSGNYNTISAEWLTKIASDFPFTQQYINPSMERYFNFTQYLLFGYNFTLQETSFGTRTANSNSIIDFDYSCNSFALFYPNQSIVNQRLLNLAINNTQIVNLSNQGSSHFATLDGTKCIEAYSRWIYPQYSSTNIPQENDSNRYINYWNNSKIFTVKTKGYTCWGTFGYDFPHGQLSDCYNLDGIHFFSGKQNDINVYVTSLSNSNLSSIYDDSTSFSILNDSYPYRVLINGRLKLSEGFSKEDQNDNTYYSYNITPSSDTYSVIHTNIPSSRIIKIINITSDISTISNPKLKIYGWSNYGNSLIWNINNIQNCDVQMSFDNIWDWSIKDIPDNCLVNGLNNITLSNFSAGEQIRLTANTLIDLNYSASSNDNGTTFNYSDVSPYPSSVVDGELVIRIGYDTLDLNNSFNQTYTFYDNYIESSIQSDIDSQLNLTFINTSSNSNTIRGIEILNKNNITDILSFIPIADQLTYNVENSNMSSQLGNINKIYSISNKNNFHYIFDFNNSFYTYSSIINNSEGFSKNIYIYDISNSIITTTNGVLIRIINLQDINLNLNSGSTAFINPLPFTHIKLTGLSRHIKILGSNSHINIKS